MAHSKSWEAFLELLPKIEQTIDGVVMGWARDNATEIPLGKILDLIGSLKMHATSAARQGFDLGTHAERIDKMQAAE